MDVNFAQQDKMRICLKFLHQQRKNSSSILQSVLVYAIIKTGSNLPARCVYVWYVFDQHLLYGNPCSVVGFDAAYA